jgi:hypothetical protein
MIESRHTRALLHLAAVLCLLCASGATCQRPLITNPFAAPGPVAPQVLAEGASREQIVAAVNQNSARVQSLTATNVSITIPDTMNLPILNGNIAAERPGRFRLTASTAVTGQEIDMGSNDELFWLWVRRNQPPAVYFCRHAQFAGSNIRQIMPVEPSWLLAAIGMVDIDPAMVFDGPLPSTRGNGTVELRAWLPSASGNLQRIILIDARRAWVVEQHVYDAAGTTLLASAVADTHRYYPIEQVSLPERVSIRLPTANFAMTINLGVMQINQLQNDRSQLWTMPTLEGYPQYDLGGASPGTPMPGQAPPRAISTSVIPTAYQGYSTTPYPVSPTLGSEAPIPAQPTNSNVGPLPRYGQRNPTVR